MATVMPVSATDQTYIPEKTPISVAGDGVAWKTVYAAKVFMNATDTLYINWTGGSSASLFWIIVVPPAPALNWSGFSEVCVAPCYPPEMFYLMEGNLYSVPSVHWINASASGLVTVYMDELAATVQTVNVSVVRVAPPWTPDINRLNQLVANLTSTVDAMNTSLTSRLTDLNTSINNLNVVLNNLKGNVTTTETEIQNLIQQYNEIMMNLTDLQAQIDALDIPEEANLTEVYENITILDLTCSYITENVSALSKLENVTNNITNNVTTTVYNNESELQVLISIDANTTDALNATIDDVANLTGRVNETMAGLEGTGQKVSEVENKSATKSALRKAVADKAPQIALMIFMLVTAICLGVLYTTVHAQNQEIEEINVWIRENSTCPTCGEEQIAEAEARAVDDDGDE